MGSRVGHCLFTAALEMESRTSCMLEKCSTTEPHVPHILIVHYRPAGNAGTREGEEHDLLTLGVLRSQSRASVLDRFKNA